MNNKEILLFVLVISVVAFRFYLKRKNKAAGKPGSDFKGSSGSMFPSSSKDDDYEPYTKK
jgi:hypothetical protein